MQVFSTLKKLKSPRGGFYWPVLNFAQATLKNFIWYVGEHGLTKPTAVFRKLLRSEKVSPLLE